MAPVEMGKGLLLFPLIPPSPTPTPRQTGSNDITPEGEMLNKMPLKCRVAKGEWSEAQLA